MPAENHSDALLVQLAELHDARKTGRLMVARGTHRLLIELQQGEIVDVVAFQPPEGEENPDAEPVVLDGFDLTGDPGLLREAARERVLQALTWADATCTFDEMSLGGGDPPLSLSPTELIREALPLIDDPGRVRAALGNLDRVLGLAFDPSQPKNVKLTPTEGYLLSRIDGTLSAREVLQLIPMDPAETERSLFSLVLAGLVTFLTLPTRQAAPRWELPLEPDLAILPGEPPARSMLPPEQLEAARRAIEASFASKVANRNHFEVLELERSANAEEVKSAYFRLAKLFHPDAHRDPGVDDMKDKLKAVFLRLGAAYDVLSKPRKRAEYESTLPRRAFSPPVGAAAPPPRPPPSPIAPPRPEHVPTAADIERREVDVLARAGKFLAEEQYWDAIVTIEAAINTLSGARLQKARLLQARAYAKNPKWLRRAAEIVKNVTADDPRNPEAYAILGGIYKASGLESRALAMYRRALELNPALEEARLALRDSAPPEEPAPPAPKPLLKRFFRRS